MTFFQAIVLGIVQGLTEFLPISSTAHLRIVPAIFGWADPGAAFTAVSQFGTMGAVLMYFSKDIYRLGVAFLRSLLTGKPFHSQDSRLAWWIGFATIPIVLCGLLLKPYIETSFRSLWVIASMLIGLALVLFIAEKVAQFKREITSINFRDTQAFGWAQAVALIPGASRSGVTITAGMFLGFTREAAARYSFLLSIPAVTLSGIYELYSIRHELTGELSVMLVVCVLVSGIVGYLSIEFLLRYLRTHSMNLFIGYRIIVGLLIIVCLLTGILHS